MVMVSRTAVVFTLFNRHLQSGAHEGFVHRADLLRGLLLRHLRKVSDVLELWDLGFEQRRAAQMLHGRLLCLRIRECAVRVGR